MSRDRATRIDDSRSSYISWDYFFCSRILTPSLCHWCTLWNFKLLREKWITRIGIDRREKIKEDSISSEHKFRMRDLGRRSRGSTRGEKKKICKFLLSVRSDVIRAWILEKWTKYYLDANFIFNPLKAAVEWESRVTKRRYSIISEWRKRVRGLEKEDIERFKGARRNFFFFSFLPRV